MKAKDYYYRGRSFGAYGRNCSGAPVRLLKAARQDRAAGQVRASRQLQAVGQD